MMPIKPFPRRVARMVMMSVADEISMAWMFVMPFTGSIKPAMFKADDGDNGPHGSRRKEYINPLGPDFLHKKAHKDETEPKSNEASLRVPVRKARRVRNGKDRRNKGKA